MKKIFLVILLFLFSTPVLAGNNLTINCSSNSCDKVENLPFFSETNIYPSYLTTQTLTVNNNRQSKCLLNFKAVNPLQSNFNFLNSLQLSVVADQNLWYSGTFLDLFSDNIHSLGEINSQSNKIYNFTASLSSQAGNEFQNLNTNFSLNFNFTCDDENITQSTNSSSNDTSVSNLCHDISPIKSPQNLRAVAGQNSVTLFWDETDDNFTYYLIAYSTNENASNFGNPNIGSKGTKSYTINNLSANTPYYFKIRTGNGCAPGPFSSIVSATPKGQILTDSNLPPGFLPNVLGAQTTENDIENNLSKNTCVNIFPFAFFLALLVNLILFRYHLFTFFVSLLSFAFDYYLSNFTCTKHPYFYLANLISFLLPLLISFRKREK